MDPNYTIKDFDSRCKLIYRGNTSILSIRYKPATPAVIVFEGKIPEAAPDITPTTDVPTSSDNELIPHIIAAIAQLMEDQGSTATSFLTTIQDPALQKIMTHLHGVVINQIQYFQLQKTILNQQNIYRWLDNKAITTGEVTLAMHDYVPEHLYAPVAGLMTELMNAIIREDNQQQFAETAQGLRKKMILFRETGVNMPLFLLSDRQGQLIGMSFVLVPAGSPIAKQELTGIIRPYRGRHLAYYLKSLAIRETFRRYPHIEIIETNCYSVNRPIIHINETLGYTLQASALQYRVDRTAVI